MQVKEFSTESMATLIAAVIGLVATLLGVIVTKIIDARHLAKREVQLNETFAQKIRELESNIEKKVDIQVENSIRVFDPPDDGTYNANFYDYFESKIEQAHDTIYITGDGFDFKSKDSTKFAKSFNNSIKKALRKDVKVTRVQIKTNPSKEWAEMMAALLEEFSPNFQFFFLERGKKSQISSVCVIDPDDKYKNVSEIMLSTTKIKGITENVIAGTGVFIEGKEKLAISFRDGILSLIKDSKELRTREDVFNNLVPKNGTEIGE